MSYEDMISPEARDLVVALGLPRATWIDVHYWRKRRLIAGDPVDSAAFLKTMPWSIAVVVLRDLPLSTVWMAAAQSLWRGVEHGTIVSQERVKRWALERTWTGMESVGDVVKMINEVV